MVVSQLIESIEYRENKGIEKSDNDLEVALYKIKLYNTDVLIALGKLNNKYKKYNVCYSPVYLVLDEKEKIFQIGVYEFFSSEKQTYEDEEGDLDITLLEGPLLYNYVTEDYIKNTLKNVKLIQDLEDDVENEEQQQDLPNVTEHMLERLDDDDDDDQIMEREKDVKKIARNFRHNTSDIWLNKHLKNDLFKLKNNEGGGDCLFATIRDAFNSIGINANISLLRDKLASNVTDEMFDEYKENYDMYNKQIQESSEELVKITSQGKKTSKVYLDLKKLLKSDAYKTDDKFQEKKEKLKEVKKYKEQLKKLQEEKNKHQKYISNAEDLMSHFNFMKNVDSISKFREFVKTADFWADSASISILEEIYNFKIIILESDNYHNGEYSNILQCGDMVPDSIVKSNEFKPYYYIIVDHNTLPIPHYQLIQYDSKSIFRFHEIPYYIREMVKNKCMNSKGKSLYDFIPKFQRYTGTFTEKDDKKEDSDNVDDAEDEEIEVTPSPSKGDDKLYNDDVVFQFYSKSKDAKPGKGSGEKIPNDNIEYKELEKEKHWRRVLSNFHVASFTLDKMSGKDLKWSSVEHYYQANKYKNEKEFYYLFTMNSKTELSKNPNLAKKAGGKGKTSKKYRQELGFSDVMLDPSFFKDNKNEKIMEDGQRAKYMQNEKEKKILLLTKKAKLQHFTRGNPPIVFYDTMRIREELS